MRPMSPSGRRSRRSSPLAPQPAARAPAPAAPTAAPTAARRAACTQRSSSQPQPQAAAVQMAAARMLRMPPAPHRAPTPRQAAARSPSCSASCARPPAACSALPTWRPCAPSACVFSALPYCFRRPACLQPWPVHTPPPGPPGFSAGPGPPLISCAYLPTAPVPRMPFVLLQAVATPLPVHRSLYTFTCALDVFHASPNSLCPPAAAPCNCLPHNFPHQSAASPPE